MSDVTYTVYRSLELSTKNVYNLTMKFGFARIIMTVTASNIAVKIYISIYINIYIIHSYMSDWT